MNAQKKVSLVDVKLPLANQAEINATLRRLQKLGGEKERVLNKLRFHAANGNAKKHCYFGTVNTRLHNTITREHDHLARMYLEGLAALSATVDREDLTLGEVMNAGRGGKGQVSTLTTRKLQCLALKNIVVFSDGKNIPQWDIVNANRMARMWLYGEIRLAEKPVGMTAEQHYYEDYARGY